MRRLSDRTAFGFAALALAVSPLRAQVAVNSPDGRNQVTVEIRDGRLTYGMTRDRRPLVLPSVSASSSRCARASRRSQVTDTTRQSHDEWWTQPWGEVARVRDHYNELARCGGGDRRAAATFTLRVPRLR